MVEERGYFCNECLTVMTKKHGDITLSHPDIGSYVVKGVLHHACDTCGSKIIPKEYALKVEIEGTGLRILNVLKEVSTLTIYDICEGLELSMDFTVKVVEQLEKDGKVFFDVTKELPEISIIHPSDKSWFNGFIKKIMGD